MRVFYTKSRCLKGLTVLIHQPFIKPKYDLFETLELRVKNTDSCRGSMEQRW